MRAFYIFLLKMDKEKEISCGCGGNKPPRYGGAASLEETKLSPTGRAASLEETKPDSDIRAREELVEYLDDIANPHPLAVTFMIILCVSILYVIYVIFIKSSPQGVWADQNDRLWEIAHGKISDRVHLIGPRGMSVDGQLHGAAVFLDNGCTGIWDYNNNLEIYDRGTPLLYMSRLQ